MELYLLLAGWRKVDHDVERWYHPERPMRKLWLTIVAAYNEEKSRHVL
jgi:hypothetical protein